MTTEYNTNTSTTIEDLNEIEKVDDTNLMIVEDEDDTKRTTVRELKKNFLGDNLNPDNFKFYSSSKINEIVKLLSNDITNKAEAEQVEKLSERIESIIASSGSGEKDSELVDARNGESTLYNRLYRDNLNNELEFMSNIISTVYLDEYTNAVFIPGKCNRVKISSIGPGYADPPIVTISQYSPNILCVDNFKGYTDISMNTEVNFQPSTNPNFSFDRNQNYPVNVFKFTVPDVHKQFNLNKPGKYIFKYSDYKCKGASPEFNLCIVYSDDSMDKYPISGISGIFSLPFTAKKDISFVLFEYPALEEGTTQTITINDFAIILEEFDNNTYINHSHVDDFKINIAPIGKANTYIYTFNNNSIFYINKKDIRPSFKFKIDYIKEENSLEKIIESISDIKNILNNKIEKCGLIEDYGIYQFFNNFTIASNPNSCTVADASKRFDRNGVSSKMLHINEDATTNPSIKQILDNTIDVFNNVQLIFYIDKTTFSNFTDSDGIRIHLSSDTPSISITNYLTYTIKKSEMVQGWNCIKRKITDFKEVGVPDQNNIKTVSIEIGRTDLLNGHSIYLNSVVFNQKMKPTLLLSFDGIYDESLTYLYPYLLSRGIPATIFLNNRNTLTNQTIDALINLRVSKHWDLGVYGCNPNKEQLTEDDNYRNQYMALRNSREWIQNNMVDNPISYSAPYGNLRPITVPILKDLGYKIARTGADSYISQFTSKDFAIPMFLMSNNTDLDSIKKKIDYAIESGQAISLYTNNVTEYGDEESSKKIMLESVVEYIVEKVEEGKLQCLTFSDFYNQCTE